MTNVLIISNKSDVTSDFIVKKLKERKIEFYRFNTEELTKTCFISLDFLRGRYILTDVILRKEVDLKSVTSVYFRRPMLPKINLMDLSEGENKFIENEILYTLEGVYKVLRDAYWISPVYSIREAENKIYQLEVSKSIGFNIPDSIITNSLRDSTVFFKRNRNNCIIKPIKSGVINYKNKSEIIFTNRVKDKPFSKEQIQSSPNFFQVYIPKSYDVRVTMVGSNAFATLIHSQEEIETQVDWRKGERSLKNTKIELPNDVKDRCIQLLSVLKLRFGAIDFILDTKGKYIFLEINPNGQWAWIEKQTGYKISDEIVNMLEYGDNNIFMEVTVPCG